MKYDDDAPRVRVTPIPVPMVRIAQLVLALMTCCLQTKHNIHRHLAQRLAISIAVGVSGFPHSSRHWEVSFWFLNRETNANARLLRQKQPNLNCPVIGARDSGTGLVAKGRLIRLGHSPWGRLRLGRQWGQWQRAEQLDRWRAQQRDCGVEKTSAGWAP